MLTIAILCAIPEEHAALRKAFAIEGAPEPGAPFPVLTGQSADTRIHLAQSGIGKTNAAALTAHLLTLHPDIDLIAFSGVAGGMNPALGPGDLIIAAETATHDYGAQRGGRLDWFRAGDIPLGPAPRPAYEPASLQTPALQRTIENLAAAGFITAFGRIISGDIFLNCRDSRDRMQAAWATDAIDMESAAFAEVARRFGKPMAILRTISDRACEESHVTFEQTAHAAAANSAGFLAAYVQALQSDPASVEMIRAFSR